jgi:membrane carboxypeptidase/penicillin-binding protein PbpC
MTGAAPIWHEVMRGLLQGRPDHPFMRPEGLDLVNVCAVSGLLPTSACQNTHAEWFITGTEPTQTDNIYQQVLIDSLTNTLANDSTPGERRQSINVLNLPVEAQAWARTQGFLLLADYSQSVEYTQQTDQLAFLSPHDNTTYRIDPNIDLSMQQIKIEVAAGNEVAQVTFYVDGNPLTTVTSAPYEAWWALSAGEHQFWVEGVGVNNKVVKSEAVTITVVQ